MNAFMSPWERAREFGRIGEAIFERWCLKRGYFIISTSRDASGGGAAMADSLEKRWIKPDLHIAMHGKSLFVDVKTKNKACAHRNRGHATTGCAVRNFEHYLKLQEETGITGALAFIQCKERCLLFGKLNEISVHSHECHNLEKVDYPTIYFDVACFDRYQLEDEDWVRLSPYSAPDAVRREWENHRRIAKEVASEWKQRGFDFGRGDRYR